MFRQRFWLLVGMWIVFFAIQIAASLVLGLGFALMGLAGVAAFGAGLEDPAALTGMGIGMIAMMALFYGAYLAVVCAQQAALVMLASPLERAAFGPALARGFKSVLPFLGLMVILILGYIAITLGLALVAEALSLGNETASGVLGVVVAVSFLPLLIYLACRFAVVIPVVAVDEVYNPLKALRRSWSATRGKVLGILLVLGGTVVLGIVLLGVPIALVVTVMDGANPDAGAAFVAVAAGFLALLVLFLLYTLFIAAVTAALHSEVTLGGAEKLEEVFA